jgi:hypothetical protein
VTSQHSLPITELGLGRNRLVLRHGKYVIKIPRNLNGEVDNEWEARARLSSIPTARCRLATLGGWRVLVMEYVEEPTDFSYKEYPNWCKYVDCAQVGWTRHGKLVAYDFGCR